MGDQISEGLREAARQAGKWEYKADNLKKITGMMLETKFNERGQEGWEFVAVCDNYAIFRRPFRPEGGGVVY